MYIIRKQKINTQNKPKLKAITEKLHSWRPPTADPDSIINFDQVVGCIVI